MPLHVGPRTALRLPTHRPSQFPVVQPCGGAIPICMVEEFDLPMEIIDRRVTKMKMISPSNREVDVGKTLNEKEWIGMCRREVRRLRCSEAACAGVGVQRSQYEPEHSCGGDAQPGQHIGLHARAS